MYKTEKYLKRQWNVDEHFKQNKYAWKNVAYIVSGVRALFGIGVAVSMSSASSEWA